MTSVGSDLPSSIEFYNNLPEGPKTEEDVANALSLFFDSVQLLPSIYSQATTATTVTDVYTHEWTIFEKRIHPILDFHYNPDTYPEYTFPYPPFNEYLADRLNQMLQMTESGMVIYTPRTIQGRENISRGIYAISNSEKGTFVSEVALNISPSLDITFSSGFLINPEVTVPNAIRGKQHQYRLYGTIRDGKFIFHNYAWNHYSAKRRPDRNLYDIQVIYEDFVEFCRLYPKLIS